MIVIKRHLAHTNEQSRSSFVTAEPMFQKTPCDIEGFR
jgi:hypothetical protein